MAASPSAANGGARTPLSRERILLAGIELADAQGLDGLSMRRLADHLGFVVMALYNHVSNKRDLLEGMLDLIAAEVVAPDPERVDWKDGLRDLAVAQHDMLLSHRWAGPISTDHFPGPNRWQIMEVTLRLLAAGGLDGHLRDLGFHAISLHIGGFTSQQIAYDFDDGYTADMYTRVDQELAVDRYPYMADHMLYHQDPARTPGERPDEFRFVLDLILDGLERARGTGSPTAERSEH